jgi:GT2 family glycosyltransferase
MNEKLDLSISIVTYNNSKIIENTVKSIIKSIPNQYNYKIFIIDNNSDDKTVDIVKGIEGEIEVIPLKSNNGFGFGHNTIMYYINSRYHIVANPDIEIEDKNQIENMFNFMETSLSTGLLSPLILNKDYSVQYLCKRNPSVFDMLIRWISPNLFKKRQDRYVMKEMGYNQISDLEYASGCFMFFRTKIFQEIKGFDDKFFMYLEDADITRRVNEISNTLFYPHARVIHAWERSSHKKLKFVLITIRSMYIYFKKWRVNWF